MNIRLLPALLLALPSCRPAPVVARIGIGYRGQDRAAAIAASTDSANAGRGAFRIEMALQGTLPGRTGSASALEVENAARLASTAGLVGVVGHGGSREALMTAPIYNEAGIPQIVPTGTSRRLMQAGKWTFQLAPNDSIEGEYLGRFVAERLHARSVTIFYVLDEYGAGLRDGLIAELTRRNVTILDAVPLPGSSECPPAKAQNDLASVIDAALLRGRPDVVVMANRQNEAGCIVSHVHARYPGVLFAAGDGLLADAAFRERAGVGADSTYLVAFWHPDRPDSVSRAFAARYERLHGIQPRHDEAMVHDAFMALATAVRAVGTDGEKVREYLASLGHERPALQGVTGPISFPGDARRLMMTRVQGSALDVVPFP